MNLHDKLATCILCIEKLGNNLQSFKSFLKFPAQMLADDAKAILNRSIIHRQTISFKLNSSGDSRFESGFRHYINSLRIGFTVQALQCIFKDNGGHCMPDQDVRLFIIIQLMKSLFSMLNTITYVSTFRELFKNI